MRILVFLITFLFSVNGSAQMLTLKKVMEEVQNNNADLKMYQFQTKAMDAMAEGAVAWDAPQISAGLFMTPYQSSYWKPQMMEIEGMNNMMPGMGSFMIQAKQMIPNTSRLKANQRYQQAQSAIETENGKAAANDLLFKVKSYYFQAQSIERKLKVLEEAQKTLQVIIQLGEQKIAYNQGSLSGIYKARSQAAILEKDKWMMEGERKKMIFALNGLMNRTGGELFTVDTSFQIKNYEVDALDSLALTVNRSDLQALDKNISVTLLKVKAEQARSLPDFGIEYGHMFAFGENPNQFSLMGMMSIPLAPWSSGMYKSSVKANRLQVEALKSQKQAMVSESVGMIYGLKNEIASAKFQLKLYNENVLPSLKKVYEVSMLAYSNNTGELFMALDAQMNLQMAKMQYWDLMFHLLNLQAEYEKQLQIN